MKKVLYLSMLFFLFSIGFFYNSMSIFADTNMQNQNIICNNCSYETCESEALEIGVCLRSCCIGKESNKIVLNISINIVKKIKLKNYETLSFLNLSLLSFDNKNLFKIHSPPYIDRKKNNYYYSNFIKIIKSNI